jgi:tetratricopeptide (TPR) repeat protein
MRALHRCLHALLFALPLLSRGPQLLAVEPEKPPAPSSLSGPVSAFHESTALHYSYAFGKNAPFLPSNATTASGQFLDPRTVPSAQYCGHCHKESYHQWRQSTHSNAFRAQWYRRNVNLLIEEKGVEYSRHCEGCHNPVALLAGSLSPEMPAQRPFEQEGVTCMACHAIQSVNTTGTGSYVLGTPAVLVDEAGKPITRPVTDAEILANLDRHSQAVMKPFYRTPEFCASCHKAAIPRALDDYKWLRAFTVYDEWQASSWSKESPLPFYRKDAVSTCQNCHMNREALTPGHADPGAKDGQLASHRWLGGNSLIPAMYKFDEQADRLIAFLKNGVLNIDIFALEKENAAATPKDEVLVAPLGQTRFNLAAGETLVADVVIQNKGIGHGFIPEQRDFYEAWVNFTFRDAEGKVLSESGFLQPDGNLDPAAHSFTNRLVNAKGELNGLHEIWRNRVLAYNNVLMSGRSQLVRYRFRIPPALHGPFTLTATVKYRRFDQHFLDFAFREKHFDEPVLEVASASRSFTLGENVPDAEKAEQRSPAAQDPGAQESAHLPSAGQHSPSAQESAHLPSAGQRSPSAQEWMRWNNYGIALLDAQQYPEAVRAFEQVAALRPDYADAYTNMAVVETLWERYDDARPNLAKALRLLPGDPRALYYRALVERNAGQVKEAVTDLTAVLEKYPRSKDALRELGFSLFQEHDYTASRSAYERLQAIDPDDLAAHYQLAILYRRLGEKQKAAIESARFADQKDDPTVSHLALEYLRQHPETASESVSWHVHDLTGDPVKAPEKIEYKYIPGAGI